MKKARAAKVFPEEKDKEDQGDESDMLCCNSASAANIEYLTGNLDILRPPFQRISMPVSFCVMNDSHFNAVAVLVQ